MRSPAFTASSTGCGAVGTRLQAGDRMCMVRGRMPAPDSLVPVGGIASLRRLLETKDPAFWTAARTATATARSFEDMFGLQRLVLKARRDRLAGEPPAVASARLAVLG